MVLNTFKQGGKLGASEAPAKHRIGIIMAVVITAVVLFSGFLIASRGIPQINPQVSVRGAVSPPNKIDVFPLTVNFVNTQTGVSFSAPIRSGNYSIELPNWVSYHVMVAWSLVPGPKLGITDVGTLNLNSESANYTLDISW